MADLTAFGIEPQDSLEEDDEGPEPDPEPKWPECVDCGYVGPEVQRRLNQSALLCTACFAEREGLL